MQRVNAFLEAIRPGTRGCFAPADESEAALAYFTHFEVPAIEATPGYSIDAIKNNPHRVHRFGAWYADRVFVSRYR